MGRLPEWQSSHPDPGNRIEDVQRMVAASTEHFGAMKVGGDAFLRHLDGMVYGADPRAGYFEGARFLHPDLEFTLAFPDGWATQNASDAVTGISPDRDAVIQLRGAQGSAAEAADRFATYGPAFRRTTHSFERLTEPAALAAQPMRIRIAPSPRAMSLQEFDAELPSSIPLAELALINGLPETAQLHAGQSIKRVTGTRR